MFRTIDALISSELNSEMALDAADLGLPTSVYFLTFAALQLPNGIWLDRHGPRRVEGVLLLVRSGWLHAVQRIKGICPARSGPRSSDSESQRRSPAQSHRPMVPRVLMKWNPGWFSAPHSYATDRIQMVLSGTWWVKNGADFTSNTAVVVPAGGFVERTPPTFHMTVCPPHQGAGRHRSFFVSRPATARALSGLLSVSNLDAPSPKMHLMTRAPPQDSKTDAMLGLGPGASLITLRVMQLRNADLLRCR